MFLNSKSCLRRARVVLHCFYCFIYHNSLITLYYSLVVKSFLSILYPLSFRISKILSKLDAKHFLFFCLVIGLVHFLLNLFKLLDLFVLHLISVLLFQLVISVKVAFFAETLRIICLIRMLTLSILLRFSFSLRLFFRGS